MTTTTGRGGGGTDVAVRSAGREDAAAVAALLYESAAAKYDQFAGDRERALRLLTRAFRRRATTASAAAVSVAEVDGRVAAALAAFPAREGDRRAARFLRTALLSLPPWRWLEALRVFRLGTDVTPPPPSGSLYVDALATGAGFRRRGAARALLGEAERRARAAGLTAVALDTGLGNAPARALYEAAGFQVAAEREPHGARPGVVAYVKRLT